MVSNVPWCRKEDDTRHADNRESERRTLLIFVQKTSFENARSTLCDECKQHDYRLRYTKQRDNQRPKLEVIVDRKEILSVVPVCLKANVVEFTFKNDPAVYPCQILQKVERNISGYRFITPPDEYIKKLFMEYLTQRPDVKKRKKIRIDAKAILTPDELRVFGFAGCCW
ncbi:MAG: hypothetical protein ISS70_18675 [Phycisphaerae bacterium]|nr:hypothetical protein [Phycisphaerae bacterium]